MRIGYSPLFKDVAVQTVEKTPIASLKNTVTVTEIAPPDAECLRAVDHVDSVWITYARSLSVARIQDVRLFLQDLTLKILYKRLRGPGFNKHQGI